MALEVPHPNTHSLYCIETMSQTGQITSSSLTTAFDQGMTRPELFACPYCGSDGLNEPALVDHVLSDHADEEESMVSLYARSPLAIPAVSCVVNTNA